MPPKERLKIWPWASPAEPSASTWTDSMKGSHGHGYQQVGDTIFNESIWKPTKHSMFYDLWPLAQPGFSWAHNGPKAKTILHYL